MKFAKWSLPNEVSLNKMFSPQNKKFLQKRKKKSFVKNVKKKGFVKNVKTKNP